MMGGIKSEASKSPNEKYMVTNLQSDVLISLRDTQYLKDFLQKQNLYTKTKFLDILRLVAGTGLVTAEGDVWKRHRKIISNSFHYEFIKTNVPMIQETTREFLSGLKPEDMKAYNVIPKVQEITGEIVGRIFFGKHLNSYTFEGKPLTLALADLMTEIAMAGKSLPGVLLGAKVMKIPLFSKHQRLMKRITGFRQICYDIIEARRVQKDHEYHDLLALLLNSQKSNDLEHRYSDEDIVNEFITFFVAGMDTTGHLIGMTFYNLSQNSQDLEELKTERNLTYNREQQVTAETLQKMDVLHCVLKETLRMHTPAPTSFMRRSLEDHMIGDLKVKKGELVRADFCFLFNNPKHFSEPSKFSIERWRNNDSKLDPYAFIPFSAGSRNCIGQHLAIIESKIIISEFLERYNFKLQDGYKLKMTIRFLYEPEQDLLLKLSPKNC
jgi:cytochrome P450 family 4 subfamily V